MNNKTRQFTSKLLDMCEEGILDPMEVLRNVVGNWMSESDVKEFCEKFDYDEMMGLKEDEEEEQYFNIGDKVVDGSGAEGTVTVIDGDDENYPIEVLFSEGTEDEETLTYTASGKYIIGRDSMSDIQKI